MVYNKAPMVAINITIQNVPTADQKSSVRLSTSVPFDVAVFRST